MCVWSHLRPSRQEQLSAVETVLEEYRDHTIFSRDVQPPLLGLERQDVRAPSYRVGRSHLHRVHVHLDEARVALAADEREPVLGIDQQPMRTIAARSVISRNDLVA